MRDKHALAGSPELAQLLRQLAAKRDLQASLRAAKQEEASAQSTVLLAELKARRRVLLRLGCAPCADMHAMTAALICSSC